MTQAGLFNLLKTTGLNVAYNHFKSPPNTPYIVYLFTDSDNFGADNKVYQKNKKYQVELYSDEKDLANEKKIEDLFDENEIFYQSSETYIESEELYQVMYEIQLI